MRKHIASLDAAIETLIASDQELMQLERMLREVTGVGRKPAGRCWFFLRNWGASADVPSSPWQA